MTRRSQLISTLLGYVSGAALTVGVWTSPRLKSNTPEATLGFLARLGLWLRLVLGLGSEAYEIVATPEPTYTPSRHQLRAYAHRLKRRETARKLPAHDLEMLMRFVPGCWRGLTLNQYRERLTRMSVMGRIQVYSRLFYRRRPIYNRNRQSLDIINLGAKLCRTSLCQAPLWPD